MPKPTAILFDFGGTLDCPSHWLDRFLTHYHDAGFDITREELDSAFDFANKAGYGAGKAMERFKLGDLVYAESPREMDRRLQRYWHRWHEQAK